MLAVAFLVGISNAIGSITIIILALISISSSVYRYKNLQEKRQRLKKILLIIPTVIVIYIIMNLNY